MKALILNSGLGTRMGVLTSEHPKCMTEVSPRETILSRQLSMLAETGVTEVVITTGLFDSVLVHYCQSLALPLHITFVHNPRYRETNYIYSIYCAKELLDDDILLMHGDLVFESEVLDRVLASPVSCMTVSSTLPLPQKDFKAVVRDGKVMKVGIEFFNEAMAAQALYHLKRDSMRLWLNKISEFCEAGNDRVYAENALNELNGAANITALDVGDMLCAEIDDAQDLAVVSAMLAQVDARTVYMCFSTDVIRSGHIAILRRARRLGRVIVGVLSDEAVAARGRIPRVSYADRRIVLENLRGVYKVVEQKTVSYKENLELLHPNYVVHGDDWRTGNGRALRDEVTAVLASYGGRLVEFPYDGARVYVQANLLKTKQKGRSNASSF